MTLLPFEKCFKDVTGGNLKIKQADYLSEGLIPIIDQGKALIGGYTNDKNAIVKCKLPCIIYGDHSRNIKYYNEPFAIGADGVKLLEATELLNSKFGYYFLQTVKLPDAGYDRSFKYLKRIDVPIPDLETQNKVVAILDKVNSLIEKREKTIELYDELLRATFLDMFGDPVINPKGWKIDSLSKFGSFKNGLNFTKNESGFAFRCLGVGDFKSQSRLSNIDSLSFINLSSKPQQDYFLQDGDLVFVRSNGNKELVGRCLVVFPRGEDVTFSGFCIRYRTNGNAVNPIYLSHLFRVPSFKKVMLQNGRGANIQNINQEILAGLKIPIPSMELQTLFSQIVEKIEGIKTKYQLSLEYLINIFNNVSQLAFKGDLTFNTAVDLEVLLENDYDFFKANSTPQTIQLLLDRVDKNEGNDKKIYEEEIYQKAKDFVFGLLQEGRIKQGFDAQQATVKLSLA